MGLSRAEDPPTAVVFPIVYICYIVYGLKVLNGFEYSLGYLTITSFKFFDATLASVAKLNPWFFEMSAIFAVIYIG